MTGAGALVAIAVSQARICNSAVPSASSHCAEGPYLLHAFSLVAHFSLLALARRHPLLSLPRSKLHSNLGAREGPRHERPAGLQTAKQQKQTAVLE